MLNVLELFAGAGGFTLGSKLAGFNTILGIDKWEIALKTNKHNNNINILKEDISILKYSQLKKHVNKKDIDIIIGGPPCQSFSTVGKRSLDDPRADLVKEYARFIKEIKPEIFIMENVKGFVNFNKGELLKELLDIFYSLGYYIDYKIYDMTKWHVPQKRERIIIVGNKIKNINISKEKFNKIWTFKEATSDLPELQNGEEKKWYKNEPLNYLQKFYRKNCEILTEFKSSKNNDNLIEMMKYIPECKGVHDKTIYIPDELKPKGGFKTTYKRLCYNKPAFTITRGFISVSGHNSIHPKENRALTIREGARLQTFPDRYIFYGNKSEKAIQIANAVPPLFAKFFLLEIKKLLNI